MNYYLTENQEDKVYKEIMNIFESKKGECTNCDTNYIFDEYNYFNIHTENNAFTVDFKTKKGRLLKTSILIKQL